MGKDKKHFCAVCGRQIVSYTVSNEHVVGPGQVLPLARGVACIECSKSEKGWEDMMAQGGMSGGEY